MSVEVGQIWEDNDPRGYGRWIKVLSIDGTHATVQSPSGRGRKTRIRLNRFRPTRSGYVLVTPAAHLTTADQADGEVSGE